MTKWKIYHNPACSKSREVLKVLRDKGIEPEVIEYLKQIPTEDELKEILAKLSSSPDSLVRVKEELYKELEFDLTSVDEIARNLSRYPKLIERPIVLKDDVAVIARPMEELKKLL